MTEPNEPVKTWPWLPPLLYGLVVGFWFGLVMGVTAANYVL